MFPGWMVSPTGSCARCACAIPMVTWGRSGRWSLLYPYLMRSVYWSNPWTPCPDQNRTQFLGWIGGDEEWCVCFLRLFWGLGRVHLFRKDLSWVLGIVRDCCSSTYGIVWWNDPQRVYKKNRTWSGYPRTKVRGFYAQFTSRSDFFNE